MNTKHKKVFRANKHKKNDMKNLIEYFSTTVKKKKRDNHKKQYNRNINPTLIPNNIQNNTMRKKQCFRKF